MATLVDIDGLKTRLAEIEAEREPLLALLRAAEAYESVIGKTLFSTSSVTVRQRVKPDLLTGRSAPIMEATDKAVAEVLEAMGPTTTSDLVDFLNGRPEIRLPPDNPINILSARLSASTKYKSRRGTGWWFSDRPWPDEVAGEAGDDDVQAALG